jgi:predicted phage tail protein
VVYGFKDWANFPGPATQTFTATQSPLTLTANLEKADIVPKRNYSTTQPTLTWTPVSWAKSYELQISTSVTFNPLLPVNNPVAASSAPEYTTSGLTAGTYYWRVRAINDAGKPGPWSQIETFIIAPT